MKTTIYVPDIECESCVKIISKSLNNKEGIQLHQVHQESLDVEYDESKIGAQDIIRIIQDRGFRASEQPFERKTFKERMRDFNENKKKYAIERKGIFYSIMVFIILTALEFIAYMGFLQFIPNFLPKYGIWLLYLNITIVLLGLGIWHFFAYKGQVTCMTGMMIGMTTGMQTGMMIGAIVGATNGFFTGSMVGMLTGAFIGATTGKSCGVMGFMQGLMSGIMAGTMGAMISVMMFTDHINIFMPIYIVLNAIIVLALPYMVFEEVVEHKKVHRQPLDFATYAAVCVIITAILVAIMVYGPKSAFFAG